MGKKGTYPSMYETIVRKLVSKFAYSDCSVSIEPWRAASFAYKIGNIGSVTFGSPGFNDGKRFYFNDGFRETDSVSEAVVFIVAHEMAHLKRILEENDFSHSSEWKKIYDDYVDLLRDEYEEIRNHESILLKESLSFLEERKRKTEELINLALFLEGIIKDYGSFKLHRGLKKKEILTIKKAMEKHITWETEHHEVMFITSTLFMGDYELLGIA